MIDFEKLNQQRLDVYNSHKVILDLLPAGFGRTTQQTGINCSNNRSNIVVTNTNILQYQIANDIEINKIKTPSELVTNCLFGKTAVLPEFVQEDLVLIPCLCNLYELNPQLFNCLRLGFLPSNWCEDYCNERECCFHKEQMKTAWSFAKLTKKYNKPLLWDLSKAHIKIGMIKSILEEFPKTNVFHDEFDHGSMYDSINFAVWYLNNYKEFIIKKILYLDKSLYEFWKEFVKLLNSFIDNIQAKADEKTVFLSIEKDILSFFDSCKKDDPLNEFSHWNEEITRLIAEKNIPVRSMNPFSKLFSMLQDAYAKKDESLFMYNTSAIDNKRTSMNYYIDQTSTISEIIKKSNKFTLGSGDLRVEKFLNGYLPDIKDYGVIKNEKYMIPFKTFYRYKPLHKAGFFYKTTLYSSKHLTKTYYEMTNLAKEITILLGGKWLVSAISEAENDLRNRVFNGFDNVEVKHFYNSEGENFYEGYNTMNIGTPITPKRHKEILNRKYGFSIALLSEFESNGELYQLHSRGRQNLHPDELIGVSFSKTIPKWIYPSKIANFSSVDDIKLIPYLKKKKEATRQEIQEEVYENRMSGRTLQNKLKDLVDSKILETVGLSRSPKLKYKIKEK